MTKTRISLHENTETRNFDNAIFIREFAIVNAYQANFNSIWNNH